MDLIIPMFPPSDGNNFDNKDYRNFCFIHRSLLHKAEWNYKGDDPEKAKKLAANIKRQGFTENIHFRVSETKKGMFEVMNGNHRIDAGDENGIVWYPAYNHGEIDQAEASRRTIEQNETRFPTNHYKLAKLLSEVIAPAYSEEDLLNTLPYSEQQYQAYLTSQVINYEDYKSTLEVQTKEPITPKSKKLDESTKSKVSYLVPMESIPSIESYVEKQLEKHGEGKAEFILRQKVNITLPNDLFEMFLSIFNINSDNSYSTKKLETWVREQQNKAS